MKTEHKIDGIPVSKYWIDKARKHLEGAKILRVEYMPDDEREDWMWEYSPLCILMQKPNGDKFWMYPTIDEEGNDGGALFTTIKDYQCACRL